MHKLANKVKLTAPVGIGTVPWVLGAMTLNNMLCAQLTNISEIMLDQTMARYSVIDAIYLQITGKKPKLFFSFHDPLKTKTFV